MPDQISTMPRSGAVNVEELTKRQQIAKPKAKIVERGANQALDRDSFLKLLITELSHQDPINPVNDKEFIAQMAQFSSLEQMHNVSKGLVDLQKFQANFIVGKQVSGKDFVNGNPLEGRVDKIIHDTTGQVFLSVGGRTMRMEDIQTVSEAQNVSRETMSETGSAATVQNPTVNMPQKTQQNTQLNEYKENQTQRDESGDSGWFR